MTESLRYWRNLVYVAVLIAIAIMGVIWWPQLSMVWREQGLTFVLAVVLMMLGTIVQTRTFIAFLSPCRSLSIWRFSPIWALGALTNYIAPLQPGVAVRVAWLSRFGISVSDSLLASWRQICVSAWIALIGLAIGLLLTGDPRGVLPAILLMVAWVLVAFMRNFWLAALRQLRKPEWLAARKDLMHRAVTGVTKIGVFGVLVQYALGALLIYWIYSQFGADVGLGEALILACAVYVSSLIAVLPGNLGILEAIYILAGNGLGLTGTEAAALAALIRAAHVAANLGLAQFVALSRSQQN